MCLVGYTGEIYTMDENNKRIKWYLRGVVIMYLDPGFGSMVIQAVVAVLAGVGAYLVVIRKKIAALLYSRKKTGTEYDRV
jgi:hypothetical protein